MILRQELSSGCGNRRWYAGLTQGVGYELWKVRKEEGEEEKEISFTGWTVNQYSLPAVLLDRFRVRVKVRKGLVSHEAKDRNGQ